MTNSSKSYEIKKERKSADLIPLLNFLCALVGIIVATVVSFYGFREYITNQNWKKAEFIAREIKAFESDPEVQNAMSMLDWENRHFTIPKKYTDTNKDEVVIITDEMVIKALQRQQDGESYSYVRAFIEESFDAFLSYLQRFELYVESGLINSDDIKPYIYYWVKVLADKDDSTISNMYRIQLWRYINRYNFRSIKQLCERFAYPVDSFRVTPSVIGSAKDRRHGGPGTRGK